MGVFQNNLMGAAAAAGGVAAGFYTHQIANSCRFNKGDSPLLSMTPGAAGNKKIWAYSFWIKRTGLGSGNNSILAQDDGSGGGAYASMIQFDNDNLFKVTTGTTIQLKTNRVFRDPSAFYHIVVATDTTQSTDTNRWKIFINGVDQTGLLATATYPAEDYEFTNFNDAATYIGIQGNPSYYSTYSNFMIAEAAFVDGTACNAATFAEEKNGVWIPKDLSSGITWGDEGWYLKFESSGDLGNDSSGNNNDFTVANIATHDQMLDSPTFNDDSNGGNFATWNPLNAGSYTTLAEGNLKATGTSSGASNPSGTFAMTSGKWYYEMLVVDEVAGYPYLGLTVLGNIANSPTTGGDIWAMRYDITGGSLGANSGANITGLGTITTTSTGVATATDGDLISWYLDCDNRKAWIAKNGVIPNSGDPANGTNPQWSWTTTPNNPITFTAQVYNGDDTILNAGQDAGFAGNDTGTAGPYPDDTGYGNFYYDPPTDFLAMCSGNLPTAAEVDPAQTDDDYPQKLFAPKLYTGDGATTLTISGMDFQPDWTWIKNRDAADGHCLFDSTRGVTELLASDSTAIEVTDADTLKSWTSDGYTVGADVKVNTSGEDYASWNWRANSGTTSTNNDGSHTSVVQVDPASSFSIMTCGNPGGAVTIGHGLGVKPAMYILKGRSGATSWGVYHESLGATKYLLLESTAAVATGSQYFNDTEPTTSVLSLGGTWGGAGTIVAYAFANVEGYCKAGSFIGNGSTDGTFIYTGFKPSMIMIKRYNRSGDNWYIIDATRNPFNGPGAQMLNPDRTATEATNGTGNVIDILSNGWKMRTSGSGLNGSGGEWIFVAMAHNPFQYATAR